LGILVLIIIIIFLFWYFGKKEYPNPTSDFYVNDFAKALSPATKNNIIEKGEILYDYSSDFEGNGGAQIVFATFLIEKEADIDTYDPTDIFNQWKIGDNDMGFLVVLYFMDPGEGSNSTPEFYAIDTAIGYQMKQYLTASRVGAIIDETIIEEEDIDMGIAKMLHNFLWVICEDAYDYQDFSEFDEESYQEYFDKYTPSEVEEDIKSTIFGYIFSGSMSLLEKIIAIGAVVLVLGGGGFFAISRGGGGLSGGAGIFRRKR
ncbi:MAG: TPM domain-containing protein, partial [Bacilli bacterium]|nr:TPM domain-containing protein [Bacilli bacterium]